MSADGDAKKRELRGPRIPKPASAKGANSALTRAVNETIGRRLEAHYRALAAEPLPDRFTVLLAELRAKELNK